MPSSARVEDDESDASVETVISPEISMSEAGDDGMLAIVLTKLMDIMGAHEDTHQQLSAQQGDFERTMTAVFNSHSNQLKAQVTGNVVPKKHGRCTSIPRRPASGVGHDARKYGSTDGGVPASCWESSKQPNLLSA